MCLVELKGSPKPRLLPVARRHGWSCPAKGEPPEVLTKTPMVRKARGRRDGIPVHQPPALLPESHQGGECDLQDQAMAYGVDLSRFKENKRAVE